MGEGIVIPTILDTSGFKKGTKELESAIKSLSRRVSDIGRSTERMAQKMISPFKRLIPTILGVGSVFGILSKAISTYMSQNEQLSAQMSAIWTALGNLLGPIITQIIDWVSTAISYFLEFLRLLGVTSKTASELSQKAQKSNKELQKTLAGFDELNVLQDNRDKQGRLKDVDPSEWMQKLSELLKNKLWDEAADMIIGKLDDIIYKFRDKAYEVGEKIGEYLQGIVHVIARVLDEVDWKQLGVGIANFLNGLLQEVEGINFGEDLGKILVSKFTIAFKMITGFLEQANLGRVGVIVGEAIKGAMDAVSRAIEGSNPAKIGQNLANFFNNIDWDGIANSLYRLIKNAWNFAFTLLHNFLTNTKWVELGAAVRKFFKNIDWEQVKEDLKQLLKDAWDAAWEFLLGVLGKGEGEEPPVIKKLEDLKEAAENCAQAVEDAFKPVWNDVIKPFLEWSGKALIPEIIEGLTDNFNKLTAQLKLFAELWTGIKEIMSGDVGSGWDRIKTAVANFNEEVDKIEPSWHRAARVFGLIKGEAGETAEEVESASNNMRASMSGLDEHAGHLSGKFYDLRTSIGNADEIIDGLAQEFQDIDDALARVNVSVKQNGEESEITRSKASEYAESLRVLEEKLLAYAEGSENTEEATKFLRNSFVELGNTSKEHTNIQQKLYEIGQKYLLLLGDQNTVMERTGDVVKRTGESTERTANAVGKMASEEENAAKSTTETLRTLEQVPGTTDNAEQGYSEFGQSAKETSDETKTTTEDMVSILKTDWDALGTAVTVKATEIKATVIGAITSMRAAVVPMFQSMTQESTSAINGLYQGVSMTFTVLVSHSYMWGFDMMANLASGIARGFNNLVEPTIRGVVDVISQYVHFSKPDKGALADFDEYGPDMMKLYAEGIESEKSRVVEAIDDVAESVASELNGETFQMPTVAGGGFLPYGVESQGMNGTSSGEVNSEVLTAILQLQGLITQFENSVENMQWVAKFGNVRAVVEEITKIQKQSNLSMGV